MTDPPRTSDHNLRSLIDEIGDVAVWVGASIHEFEYISSGIEDIWGVPAEKLEEDGSRVMNGVHPEDRDAVSNAVHRSINEGTQESITHRVVRPDGTVRWVNARFLPIGEDGEGGVGVFTDITEQKRHEEELAALNRVLRHDIRNDLTIVLAWAEALEAELDESGQEKLRKIISSCEHMVELTDISRDYAKTVSGEEDAELEGVSLRPHLAEEIERCRESYGHAEITAGEIPDVSVLANEMLSSVFKNVLNNAVQHNDTSRPVVEIECETSDDDVRISIADNGPGIPDEQKERIFEEEMKGIDSSGSGVGLYLVRTLVEQFGGEVRVSDNEPTGTVFSIQLPLAA